MGVIPGGDITVFIVRADLAGSNYGSGQGLSSQPLDYAATYASAYSNGQYYGGGYPTYAATTTTTYQLAQLPPCTTLAGATEPGTNVSSGINDLSPYGKSEVKKCRPSGHST